MNEGRGDAETRRRGEQENIRSFRDLRVWQGAIEAAMRIFEISKKFPLEERYSLTDQIRRSSRSVAANIAEAWRKRRYEAAFVSKLNDAESEAAETQTWLELCYQCGYISDKERSCLDEKYEMIIGQIVVMIRDSQCWLIPRVPASSRPRVFSTKGQATTEMVLLVPLFLIVAIGIVKIFALSVMLQKMELAMYYAGRRWMLESHKNYTYHQSFDMPVLVPDIESKVAAYLGAGDEFKEKILGFKRQDIFFKVKPTIIYGVLNLKVRTKGLMPFQPESENEWEVIKYVATRDRPIKWNIPSVAVDGD
ncbi:MAG: four helix bundle protein [Elusimicrobia bacterium]|nr:four helix bundle protein [Elusimicrobiota bacterium]